MSDDFRKTLGDDPELQKRLQAFLVVRNPIPSLYEKALEQPGPQWLVDTVMARNDPTRVTFSHRSGWPARPAIVDVEAEFYEPRHSVQRAESSRNQQERQK